MNGYAPCGQCRALVPARTGCEHWRPRRAPAQPRLRDRRRDEMSTEELAALRERNRAASKRSRDKKREKLLPDHARAVAQLTRIAGISG